MNALFEPARAGFVVFACLLAACSGATEPGSDGSGTSGESRTVAAPSPSSSVFEMCQAHREQRVGAARFGGHV